MNNSDRNVIRMRRYRILILISIMLAGFLTQFHRASSGTIKSDLAAAFSLNATQFATFSSMYFYPYMIMQLPVGILADKIGSRKLIVGGSFLAALGTLIFSQAATFPVLCLGRLLVGIGVSAPIICKDKLLSEWYSPGKIVTMGGISSFFQNMGGVVAQTPLSLLVGLLTWRTTFVGLAAVSALVGVFALLFVRNKPSDKGFPSELELEGYSRKSSAAKLNIGAALKKIVTNRLTWPLFLIMPVEMGAYTMFSGTWGVSYIQDVFSYSGTQATKYTTYLMLGWCISIIFVCAFSDRIRSRKKPIIALCTLSLLIWILLSFGSSFIARAHLLGVVCFLFGITGSLTPLLFATAREVNDPACLGTTLGVVNMIGMGAGAVFPIICGAIMDKHTVRGISGAGLYSRAFLFLVILLAIALIVSILFLKETHCKNIHLQSSDAAENKDK